MSHSWLWEILHIQTYEEEKQETSVMIVIQFLSATAEEIVIQSYVQVSPFIGTNDTTQKSEFSKALKQTFHLLLDHLDETDHHSRFTKDGLSDAQIPQDIAIKDLTALKTTGDGNCLFHAASLALTGTEVLSHVLRLQTACEIYLHNEFYADHPRIVEASTSPTISTSHLDTLFTYMLSDEGDAIFCRTRDKVETTKLESKLTCIPGRWCSLLHALVLSSFIQRNTYMVYPDCNYGIKPLLNGKIRPRCSNIIEQFDTIYILWSRDLNLDNIPRAAYQLNQFVCLSICNNNTVTRETQKRRTSEAQNVSKGKKVKNSSNICYKTSEGSASKNQSLLQSTLTFHFSPRDDVDVDHVDHLIEESSCTVFDSTLDNSSSNSIALETSEPLEVVNLHESQSFDNTFATPISVSSSNFDTFLHNTTRPVVNATKYFLIKNRIPPEHFVYPSKEYKDTSKKSGKRKRSCQHQWFEQFKFITYSMENDGFYCLPCILFPIENTPGGHARLLIALPNKNWKDTVADMKNHSVSAYHKASFEQIDNFIEVMEKEELGIYFILDEKLKERVAKNRKVLESILRCIEFCCRHGIALRGHRDDADIENSKDSIDPDQKIENTGNFKGLLKLYSDLGDTTLTEHLATCAKSATYISKTSQNELLVCIKKYIQSQIIHQIQNQPHGPLFGIQADECTDVSSKEQLGIVLRYLINGITPVEKLIEFVECQETTGAAIAEHIIERINELGLNMINCSSQSYDNAANMTGIHKGCATNIKESFPKAKFFYCMNHDSNLAVSKSCQLPEMMIMLENTKHLDSMGRAPYNFGGFASYLRSSCTLSDNNFNTKKRFMDAKAVTEANSLLTQKSSTSWILALCTNLHFSGYLCNLSKLLQGPTKDILFAFQKIIVVKAELKDIRQKCEEEFKDVWTKANTMGRITGTELIIPRRCGRQSLRNNTPASTPMEY
ncbi:unnamed protein product [Mytilus coruscus]|uniref:OTU domain-containing protein n=1 Tax=Mytilus coruscus TaxID=42192 RepID=A0A6J8EXI1_MYTCO|nr:unnamed protein product [Mytilus coruscus]